MKRRKRDTPENLHLRKVLFQVAITEPYVGNDGSYHCPHCRWNQKSYSVVYDDFFHEATCVVKQARLLLKKMKVTILLYSYTWQQSGDGVDWKISNMRLLYCYSDNEARIQAGKDMRREQRNFRQYNPLFRCKARFKSM